MVATLAAILALAPNLSHSATAKPAQNAQARRIQFLISKLNIPDRNRGTDVYSGGSGEGFEARQELIVFGEQAVPALINALSDDNGWRKVFATEALAEIGDSRAIEPIYRKMVQSTDYALIPIGIRALRSFNPTGRLRRWITHDLIEDLQVRTRNPGAYVAWCAADSLTQMGEPTAMAKIAELLPSHDSWEMWGGKLGWEIVPFLTRYGSQCIPAVEPYLNSSDEEVQYRAASVLAMVGDRRATPYLARALQSSHAWQTAKAASKLHDDALLPLLLKMLQSKETRDVAFRALAGYKSKVVTSIIVGMIPSLDERDAIQALRCLATTGERDIVPDLLRIAPSLTTYARWELNSTLGSIGDSSVLPYLRSEQSLTAMAEIDPLSVVPLLRRPDTKHDAIYALSRVAYSGLRAELLKELNATNNPYRLFNAFAKVGTAEDIPMLMKHIHNKEYRKDALNTIVAIRKRLRAPKSSLP